MKLHKPSAILDGQIITLLSARTANMKLHQNNSTYYSVYESLRVKVAIVYLKIRTSARTDRHGFWLRRNMSTYE